ncbi:MAG: hypothetical protein LBU36_05815 [Clostridiales bacterium]|jgi:hypothetical protein|nr:hypothetical protein [Clostridiales bacterium]
MKTIGQKGQRSKRANSFIEDNFNLDEFRRDFFERTQKKHRVKRTVLSRLFAAGVNAALFALSVAASYFAYCGIIALLRKGL